MVNGAAVDDAVERARRLPSLRVGLHLVLIDGRPVLPRERIPDLVDARGELRADMFRLGLDIVLRPKVRAQLAAEIEAQFAAFRATGLPLDHVNAHHHFHVHPTIAGQMVEIGKRYGMNAVRVPLERASLLDEQIVQVRIASPRVEPILHEVVLDPGSGVAVTAGARQPTNPI